MYFVDRNKIEELLIHMSTVLEDYKKANFENPSKTEQYALERMAHIIIESILDVGNSMIDGFIMRDPGSYEDIIDILEDEKVVKTEEAQGLKEVILLRKMLVQAYTNIDADKLLACIKKNINHISRFPEAVRSYIENELGPVSAFIPQK